MWSGNVPGQGESYPTQWALNPSAQYLHMPPEQVDWASLAQQWIKMKEEAPQMEKEQGEAPMDITKDDSVPPAPAPQTVTPAQTPVVPTPPAWPTTQIPTGTDGGSWWGWSQTGGTGSSWAITGAAYSGLPATDAAVPPAAPAFPYSPAAPPAPEYVPPPPNVSGYWPSDVRVPGVKDEVHSWDNRNHKKHHAVPEPVPELDAAKRRQLPAWIREGLEKMEREKQKKAESERLERERREAMMMKPQGLDEVAPPHLDGNGYEQPPKSKFDSESSEEEATSDKDKPEEDEYQGDSMAGSEGRPRRSRFDMKLPSPPKPVLRTKEQILQAVMTDVRKILTQILMEVTTEEIQKACEEVNRHFRRKAPATTLRKTQALTSLTGKLGLGIYGSDSESEESSDEKVTNDRDSDQELKVKIERLKNEFVHTERYIEREVLEQEEREKRQLLWEKRESSEEGDRSFQQVHTLPPRGAPMDKASEYKPPLEESYRLKEPIPATRGEAPVREAKGPVNPPKELTRAERGSSSSQASASGRKGERRRRESSSSSSSSTSSSSTSSSSPPRRRRRSPERRSRTHKRRRHHSHRRRSSSSSSSPRRHRHHRR